MPGQSGFDSSHRGFSHAGKIFIGATDLCESESTYDIVVSAFVIITQIEMNITMGIVEKRKPGTDSVCRAIYDFRYSFRLKTNIHAEL